MAMRLLVVSLLASTAVDATNVGGSAGEQPSSLKLVMSNESSNAFTCRSDCHGNYNCRSGCSNFAGGICCRYAGQPGCHATRGCQSGYASNPGSDVCCSNNNAMSVGESGTKEAKEQVVKDDVGGSAGEEPSSLKLVMTNESSNAFTCRSDCHGNYNCRSGCSNFAGGICCRYAGQPGCHATRGCQSGYASNPGSDVCCSNNNAMSVGESGTKEAKDQVVKDDVGGSAGEEPSSMKLVMTNESSNAFTCRSDCHGNYNCRSGCSNSAGGICCRYAGQPGCHATRGCQSGYASNPGSDVCCSNNNAMSVGESGTKETSQQIVVV